VVAVLAVLAGAMVAAVAEADLVEAVVLECAILEAEVLWVDTVAVAQYVSFGQVPLDNSQQLVSVRHNK
jgi:hypothetical protein